MTRPTYQEFFLATPPDGHAGLWYEKYCNTWERDSRDPPNLRNPLIWSLKATGAISPKLAWVNTVTGNGYVKEQGEALLAEHQDRMRALCKGRNAIQLRFTTTSRLVIGIGQDHPIENGFLWHPTLGVPYIPGSSIKGMLRNWTLTWNDTDKNKPWFEGATDKGVGGLIFLDALPLEVPKLEADVITPHYGPYYIEPQKVPPADWHNPMPTPFLTVALGQTFTFNVARRDGAVMAEGQRTAIETALREALETIGIGAKTAVGYGRMEPAAIVEPAPARDMLKEFKTACLEFTDFQNQGKKQIALSRVFERLSADEQQVAETFLLETRGRNPSHYARQLKALVFRSAPP